MDGVRAGIAGALAALALGGCVPITLHESKLEKTMPESIERVVTGETTRAQVRELLGEPLIASDYWRFDAFRMRDANVGVVVFPPYVPIPAWTTETAYALVSYAEDGRVLDSNWTSENSGVWSIGHDSVLTAGVGNVRLGTADGALTLAASPERRDAYLREHAARDRCSVIIGCAGCSYDAKLRIDGRSDLAFPATVTPLAMGLLAVEIAPGHHRIDAVGTEAKFAAAAEIVCDAGDRRYVSLNLEYDAAATGYGSWRKLNAQLETSSEMPEAFREQWLLVWASRQWLVPQEPGP